MRQRIVIALAACLVAAHAAAAATGRRTLASGSDSGGTYDAVAVECQQQQDQCNKISCSGLIQFSCDDKGDSKCTCVSAGLASCFPGSATVATRDGPRRLADLELGEEVLAVDGATGRLRYSPVALWSSRRPAEASAYLTVHTDAGLNLTVTPGHYLFAWRGEAAGEAAAAALASPAAWPHVLPGQLSLGDVLPVVAAAWDGSRRLELARVVAVERGQGQGVYMPHTLTGAIVVDGIVASELTSIVPPALAGPALHRTLAGALRLALRALPASAVEAAVRGVSSWAHGGGGDAAVSAQTLLARS